MITRFLTILGVILVVSLVQTFVDDMLGVDLSHLPRYKRIIHEVVYELSGGAVLVTYLFCK